MTQHSAGIPWREWNDDAFAEARERDLPVLLDIGAVWCHWCHVMDTGIPGDPIHTGTYSDPGVQQRIVNSFIPIKVDTDRRPDINSRYNTGGWPATVFLTPDGEALYGETYVPPPRMVALLDYLSDIWQNKRPEVQAQTQKMRNERARTVSQPARTGELDTQTLPNVISQIVNAFDPEYGGFGSEPKFPHPDALLLATEYSARTGDPETREVVLTTLHGMANGGMYDPYAGGFFRYSTTRDWSIPHYEKMLEDNAKLTRVYALAAHALSNDSLWETVRTAHHWILTDLRDPQTGAFAGSQDADAEEHYYGHPLAVRATLPTPYIDRTHYTGWNALAVSSFATRYALTGDRESLQAARQAFASINGHIEIDAQGNITLPHILGDNSSVTGLLEDLVSYLSAAIDLYEANGEPGDLANAVQCADTLLTALQDTQGGFYDIVPVPGAIGALAHPRKDMTANAESALALLRLSVLTDKSQYRAAGERALRLFVLDYAGMGYFGASYARAVDAYLQPSLHIVLTGDRSDSRHAALRRASFALPYAGRAITTLDTDTPHAHEFPAAEDGSPRAFVCINETCHAPVTSPEALLQTVTSALQS